MKNRIPIKPLILTAIFAVSFVLLFSCKNSSENAAEKAIEKSIKISSGEDVDVDISNQKTVVETEEGRVEFDGSAKSWPAAIPSEVPEFRYGKIKGLTTNESDEAKGWTIIYSDVPGDAADKYKSELKSEGFSVQSVSMGGMGGSVTAEKGNIAVVLMAGEDQATVSVQIQ
jgi:hypothetical protein